MIITKNESDAVNTKGATSTVLGARPVFSL
jgi:hypothetical protein